MILFFFNFSSFPFHIPVGLFTFGKVYRRNSDLSRHSVCLAASAKQTLKVSLSSPPPSTPPHPTPPTHTLHSSLHPHTHSTPPSTHTHSTPLPSHHHHHSFLPPPRHTPSPLLPRQLLFWGHLADLASQGGVGISKLNSLLTFSKVTYSFGTYPGRFWQHAWSPSSRLETTTEPNMCVICVRFSLCLSYVILSCCLRVVSVSVSVSESVSVCLPKFPSRYVALNSLIRYSERRGIGHVLFSTYSQPLMGKIQWSLRWISGASDSTLVIFRWAVLATRDEPDNGLRCSSARSSDTIKGVGSDSCVHFCATFLPKFGEPHHWERSHHKVYVGELAEGPFTHS